MIRQFTRWGQTLDQTWRCRTLIHSTWHGTSLPVRLLKVGDQVPWHLLVRLFKLETPNHFKSRISGSTCTLLQLHPCNGKQ